MTPKSIAPHVHQLPLGFVSAYAIETPEGDWVLVDTGLKANLVSMQALDAYFGKPPLAILLTHGHMDHVGCAVDLAQQWGVKVYAHRMERPYLVGKSIYPPKDPTVGGPLAQLFRAMPMTMVNLTGHLELLPDDGILEFLPGWRVIETPGHSPGHVSYWHESDRILIAGDALCTANMDTVLGITTKKPELARPGSPITCDWVAAKASVGKMADLEPVVIAAGHGEPMSGGDLPQQMRDFFHNFKAPEHGRYVGHPAVTDENGVVSLPPAPKDDFGRNVTIGAATLGVAAVLFAKRKK